MFKGLSRRIITAFGLVILVSILLGAGLIGLALLGGLGMGGFLLFKRMKARLPSKKDPELLKKSPVSVKKPAEAALAPDGPTQATTGTSESRIFLRIVSIDTTMPPGVSSRISTSVSPAASASSIALVIRRAVTGLTVLSNSTRRTTGSSA